MPDLYSFCFYDEDGFSAGCMWPGTYTIRSTTWNEEHQQSVLGPVVDTIFLPEPSATVLLLAGVIGLVVLRRLR